MSAIEMLPGGQRQVVQLGIGQAQLIPRDSIASMLVGSCIGLFMYDPLQKVAAAAHVALPESLPEGGQGRFADAAPGYLLQLLKEVDGNADRVVVKIAGAACMFGNRKCETIGELNIDALDHSLSRLGLRPLASHLRGESARQLHFDSRDGTLKVTLVAGETVEI